MSISSSSSFVNTTPQYQVFINFRGELRHSFISHLAKALRDKGINISIDDDAEKGQPLDILFEKIEESRIALAIISEGYTKSEWCLNELVKIKERMDQDKLVAIPVFYKLEPSTVKYQTGVFGDAYRKKGRSVGDNQMDEWKKAMESVSTRLGLTFDGKSNENVFISEIVKKVLLALDRISSKESENGSGSGSGSGSMYPSQNTEVPFGESKAEISGLKQRLEELKERVDSKRNETRIVGVVGMPGIGKTTLVKELYETLKSKFVSHGLLQDISRQCDEVGLKCLPGMLLQMLLKLKVLDTDEETYEPYKTKLLKNKVFIVLDGVSDRTQIQVLLERHCDWTRKGSKIVIATSDKSLIQGIVNEADIYVVPQLNHRDGLNHFLYYAFDHWMPHKENKEDFMKLSREFAHYARGHPLALQRLGEELRGKTVAHWKEKLDTLAQSLIPSIREALQVSYDALSQKQKDMFLDIACFRSHDLVYVKSLLDSSGPEFTEVTTTMDALMDKFLISISDNRVEMHDLMYMLARELSPKAYAKDGRGRHRIWLCRDQSNGDKINVSLKRPGGGVKVRSIFVDLSDMKNEVTLDTDHFKMMRDLRYLKFYSSHCPQECEPKKKIYIPDGLVLPLEEVRSLHWLKFPLDELPPDFKPKNLVDLKLPYSKIKQIWEDEKDIPKLKWVDLNHSSKLDNLSGLSKAQNLERLNLEGCTALTTLPLSVQDMVSLVFLNLKGCTALESLPKVNLRSLKTLVLSNCSSLKNFRVISEALYALHLDGTAITTLPTDIAKLTELVKLNMKNCKMLETLPEGFGKLKNLQELVFSGCSMLSSLLDEMENMKCLEILMLDGTAIEKIPKISSLQRLCLSRNDNIRCLPDNISLLSQLKWLDLKYCKNLLSITELPRNLQCLDAHGCDSLKTVANPLATHMPPEQIHSTIIFTNCNKLDRTAKEEITAYAQRKCQLLSNASKRCNESFVPEALFSTCFPNCEVPSWFCHESVGSMLNLKLPPHWNENRFVGMALCAVVTFPNCQEQIKSFSVTCKFSLESKDGSRISFDCLVGRWNKHGNKLDKMTSDHVFICYTRCSNNIKCLEDQHSGVCTPTAASFEFGVTDEKARFEVLKCGLRLVYASDEPLKKNSDKTIRRDNDIDAVSYKTSRRDVELQEGSNPITNGCFSNGSGSLSPSGEFGCPHSQWPRARRKKGLFRKPNNRKVHYEQEGLRSGRSLLKRKRSEMKVKDSEINKELKREARGVTS